MMVVCYLFLFSYLELFPLLFCMFEPIPSTEYHGFSSTFPLKIINLINENQNKKTFLKRIDIVNEYPLEKEEVHKKYSEISMDIVYPKVAIGIKLPGFTKDSQLKQKMFKLILDVLLGYSSKGYQELLDKRCIIIFFFK